MSKNLVLRSLREAMKVGHEKRIPDYLLLDIGDPEIVLTK